MATRSNDAAKKMYCLLNVNNCNVFGWIRYYL